MSDDDLQKIAAHAYRRLGVPKPRTETVVSQANVGFFERLGRDEFVLWGTTPTFYVYVDLAAGVVGMHCSCEDETGICNHALAFVKLAASDVSAIPRAVRDVKI